MLSQQITKQILFINQNESNSGSYTITTLKELTNEFENAHNYLYSNNKNKVKNPTIDSLYRELEPYKNKIIASSKNVVENPKPEVLKESLKTVSEAERPFLIIMDSIVGIYQKNAENKLKNLKTAIYILTALALLVMIAEFIFVLLPVFNQLYKKNIELSKINSELVTSENEIRTKMDEVSKLKVNLEKQQQYNKIFIDKAPSAIAMFDTKMRYIAASERWKEDYKLQGQEIIGRSHYDVFPEIGDDWKQHHQECLKGAINKCDEAPFRRADGSLQWITWDVRPWYISENEIGGLLMNTADITRIKEKDEENRRIKYILDKTNEVARIGTWEFNLITNELVWSKVIREIHEVSENFEPDLETATNFYKEGGSREKIRKAVSDAIENGKPFDLELEIITAKENNIWIRAIGQAEFEDGNCTKVFGVFQDINSMKLSEKALDKANKELKTMFNSGPVGIVSTDLEGKITFFNNGAEMLLQYSADEIIGEDAHIIHLEEEIVSCSEELSAVYGNKISPREALQEIARRETHNFREWTFKRKDGTTFPVELILSVVRNEAGDATGYMGVSTDITERVENRQKIIKANNDLELLAKRLMNQNTQLADFAHITSHNLRAPVSNLNSLLDFYKTSECEEDKNLLFEKFESVIHHLTSTLNTLVEAIKTKNESEKDLVKINFEKILNKTEQILSGQILKSGAIIKRDFSKIPEIKYNIAYMESIFLNLISNSIKYCSNDRIPEISIKSEEENGNVKLIFKDNGLGIDLKRHGQKLFGLNKTFHRHPEAKGVGLYMTKTQIESMGGTILATSKVNEGTIFTINF